MTWARIVKTSFDIEYTYTHCPKEDKLVIEERTFERKWNISF